MYKASLGPILLVISIACAGCSGGGHDGGAGGNGATGGGGGGGGGPNEAASFDADNALPASSASAIAMAAGAQLGLTVSSVIAAAAPPATALGTIPKASLQLPGLCPQGGNATLDDNQPGSIPSFQPGQDVTLTFVGCVGSVFSGQAIDGTLVLTIDAVSGSYPSEATANVNLTVGSDTTITGSFKAIANIVPPIVDLCLGDQRDTDILTITRGSETIEFACFKIRQEISLFTGAADGAFEPVGVVRRNGTQVFTMNSYTEQPPSIGFAGGTATSGHADMSSGNGNVGVGGLAGFCATLGIGGTAPGNGSFIANEFAGDACVMVTGQEGDGTPISHETTWNKLLNADFSPGGATCSSQTEAVPGPTTCDLAGTDREPIADAQIVGDGPEPDRKFADTNFGGSPSLLVKSVPNLGFTRKVYIVFDVSGVPSFTKASLVLTVDRHIGVGPQPVNVFGITDDDDWDPNDLPETKIDDREPITWNNAPRNLNSWIEFQQFEQGPGVPLLIGGYDFDLGGDGVADDPGTSYALDITEYVRWAIGELPAFSSASPGGDPDDKITILMAVSNPDQLNVDASLFFSKDITEECDRPFLHFE
jgi:hypothetical protein